MQFMSKYSLIGFEDFVTKLGEGGFGSVVRCVNRTTGVHVAAKFITHPQDSALRAWRRIKSHPNIVSLVDHYSSESGEAQVAVMSLCHGVDVATWVQESGPVNEQDAGNVLKYMVRAVSHVHACNVLHRDLKLENFVFDDAAQLFNLNIRLCDFDSAKSMDDPEFEATTQGTLLYMAPEVLAGGPCTTASDVYAIGVCLYLLLTGHFPYGVNQDVPREEPDLSRLSKLSPEAQELVRGMLQSRPNDRLGLHDIASHAFLQHRQQIPITRRDTILDEMLTQVASAGSKDRLVEQKLAPGTFLFRQGDLGEDLFLINSGSAEVWKDGMYITTLHAGDMIGEMSLLYNHCRSATIKSGSAGVFLIKLQAQQVREVWEENKGIGALRSVAQLGSQRDVFNKTLAFSATPIRRRTVHSYWT